MYRQAVMIACEISHSTPWMRVKPDFEAVQVSAVEEGGDVCLEVEGYSIPFLLSPGISSFLGSWTGRVRFVKAAGPKPVATTVEILRGSASRHPDNIERPDVVCAT